MSPASVSINIFSRVVVFSIVRGFKYSEVVSRHGPISQRQVSTQSRHLAWDTAFSFWHDGRHDFGPAKRKFVDYLNHYFLHVFLGHNAWWFTYPSDTWSGRFDKRATRDPNEKLATEGPTKTTAEPWHAGKRRECEQIQWVGLNQNTTNTQKISNKTTTNVCEVGVCTARTS